MKRQNKHIKYNMCTCTYLDLNGAMHLRDPSTDPAMTPSLIPLLRFDGKHVMPHTIGAAEAPASCKPRIRDSIVRRRLSSTSSELCSLAFSKSGTVLACGVIPLAVSGVGVEKTGVPACRYRLRAPPSVQTQQRIGV